MKTTYWTVCTFAFAVLCWKVGYDSGLNDAVQYCPAVQGEKLVSTYQTVNGTTCTYVQNAGYGRATKKRKI